jgi:hypothetical protein
MKTKTLKAFILKALLIITGITFGFASFNKCDAQSIVGKVITHLTLAFKYRNLAYYTA